MLHRVILVLSLHAVGLSEGNRQCISPGLYTNSNKDCPLPSDLVTCERGHFCTGDGVQRPCPPGTFGSTMSLSTPKCSGPCPAGKYCPKGATNPLPCSRPDVYCPLGSASPLQVPQGYYALGPSNAAYDIEICPVGYYCQDGVKAACPEGYYTDYVGATAPLLCPTGSYCPPMSTSNTLCPPGHYGAVKGLSSTQCSGECEKGFYCPAGSVSSRAYKCPRGFICPRGTETPLQVPPGSYAWKEELDDSLKCPLGSYCPLSNDGKSRYEAMPCPAGTFGNAYGLQTPSCSGQCAPGFYCPRGSIAPDSVECGGIDRYCPIGSDIPLGVDKGMYTINTDGTDSSSLLATNTRSKQLPCPLGFYCVNGQKSICPEAVYGNETHLSSPFCSGKCPEGFYCPPNTIQPIPCGSTRYYCPRDSALPTQVDVGHCTIHIKELPHHNFSNYTFTSQRIATPGEFALDGICYKCPAGHYGSRYGDTNTTCTGVCSEGYFCPEGSVSEYEKECGGANVYCSSGSKIPTPVRDGFYTSLYLEEPCAPGRYRDYLSTIPTFLDVATQRSPVSISYGDAHFPLADCTFCPPGYFKHVKGNELSLCIQCPLYVSQSSEDRRTCECYRQKGGKLFDASLYRLAFDREQMECILLEKEAHLYNLIPSIPAHETIYTRVKEIKCQIGHYCNEGLRYPCPAGRFGDKPLETNEACSGQCESGFYCPLASTTATERACGYRHLFCPAGSAVPRVVEIGYYSIRFNAIASAFQVLVARGSVQDDQKLCEPGYYCIDGAKYICPAGRYGNKAGETSPLCTDKCQRGYYCLEGSTTPRQYECGDASYICRTGSLHPQQVFDGYYSIGSIRNNTQFHQLPCPRGHFCKAGIPYECPEGYYGAKEQMTSPKCSGKCPAGYRCPIASIDPTAHKCGQSDEYCPEGSGRYPLTVDNGYYGVGETNQTRSSQKKCPQGHFCRHGLLMRCPPGTYGNLEGESNPQCRGWCPSGFYCPYATIDYRLNVCPTGSYSSKGSESCIPCPQTVNTPPMTIHLLNETQCNDKRECCFLG